MQGSANLENKWENVWKRLSGQRGASGYRCSYQAKQGNSTVGESILLTGI